MSDLIKAVILGIVEGLTEFLPISSTGHLILVNQFIAFDEHFTKMFDVIIQLGAIFAVVVYFWKRLNPYAGGKGRLEREQTFEIWKKTLVSLFPAIAIVAFFYEFIEKLLSNPVVVSVALVVGGVFLIYLENQKRRVTINSMSSLDYKTAFLIGVFQCLAMIPGTSRSAATIIGAILLGASRVVAAEYSFFLAIPTMIAASGYSLMKLGFGLNSAEWAVLATGFVVAFFTAWLVVAGFMSFIGKRDFKGFGYYRIILGCLILAYFWLVK